MEKILHVGLDVGSTTVKIIVMDSNKNTIYKRNNTVNSRCPKHIKKPGRK